MPWGAVLLSWCAGVVALVVTIFFCWCLGIDDGNGGESVIAGVAMALVVWLSTAAYLDRDRRP